MKRMLHLSVACLALAGCTSSSDSGTAGSGGTATGGSSGASGAAGSAGSGGTDATGGSAGSAGAGGSQATGGSAGSAGSGGTQAPDGSLGDDAGTADGASADSSTDSSVSYPEFGNTCVDDSECGAGECILFGNGSKWCTLPCSAPEDCPVGSQGQKCNQQGYCRP